MNGVVRWTGPTQNGDVDTEYVLLRDLPEVRWPFGGRIVHDDLCLLLMSNGTAGSYCDCAASEEEEEAR